MNPDLITAKAKPQPYFPPVEVLKVRDIENRIRYLTTAIDKEKNKKEQARLIDEQAALKLTLRLTDAYTVRGKCVR